MFQMLNAFVYLISFKFSLFSLYVIESSIVQCIEDCCVFLVLALFPPLLNMLVYHD